MLVIILYLLYQFWWKAILLEYICGIIFTRRLNTCKNSEDTLEVGVSVYSISRLCTPYITLRSLRTTFWAALPIKALSFSAAWRGAGFEFVASSFFHTSASHLFHCQSREVSAVLHNDRTTATVAPDRRLKDCIYELLNRGLSLNYSYHFITQGFTYYLPPFKKKSEKAW